MAQFRIEPATQVKEFQDAFKKAFGPTLRVYTTVGCHAVAKPDAALGKMIDYEAPVKSPCWGNEIHRCGEAIVLDVCPQMQVQDFEKLVKFSLGFGVQVANSKNTKLSKNDAPLCEAGE